MAKIHETKNRKFHHQKKWSIQILCVSFWPTNKTRQMQMYCVFSEWWQFQNGSQHATQIGTNAQKIERHTGRDRNREIESDAYAWHQAQQQWTVNGKSISDTNTSSFSIQKRTSTKSAHNGNGCLCWLPAIFIKTNGCHLFTSACGISLSIFSIHMNWCCASRLNYIITNVIDWRLTERQFALIRKKIEHFTHSQI